MGAGADELWLAAGSLDALGTAVSVLMGIRVPSKVS
jgi:hypothetical protein